MKRLAYILLLLQVVTTILQPLGNPSALSLHEMYHQCSLEDHDITPLDFVFEHLLNFESIINYFEGEVEEEHQPYQSQKNFAPVPVTVPDQVRACFLSPRLIMYRANHLIYIADIYPYPFYADIFHPPIA